MPVDPRSLSRRWAVASCVPLLLVAGLVACASSARSGPAGHDGMPGMPGMDHGAMAAAPGATAGATGGAPGGAMSADMAGMPGAGSAADGLAAERDGYRLDAAPAELPAGRATGYPFTITGPDGRPVTDFTVHQTKKLHFYAIRSDLTGFQHLHPVMAADGTWTADLTALAPGTWRMYASFVPAGSTRRNTEIVLSRTVQVAGEATPAPLPAPAGSTTVDGYTVALRSVPEAGAYRLTVTVGRDGRPVTDLQPYLDSYAHLTAFHEGDHALSHVHPTGQTDGDHGGPELTLYAMLGSAGSWRVFLQFQTAGQLHTAELTLHVA